MFQRIALLHAVLTTALTGVPHTCHTCTCGNIQEKELTLYLLTSFID